MKTSEEFVRELKEKNGEQMTRDGQLIRDMDDKELLKRVLERYPGERDNIVDLDEFLGETELKPNPIEKTDMEKKFDEVKKSPSFLSKVANRFTESAGDVADTVKGIGGQFKEAYGETKDLLTDKEVGLAQKFSGTLGEAGELAGGVIGEVTTGAGKILFTQEMEDKIKDFTAGLAEDLSETELAQKTKAWYDNLDPVSKRNVDAVGGMLSLITEVIGLKGASKVVKPIAETAGDVAKTTIDTTTDIVKAVPSKVDEILEPRRLAKIEENKKLADEAIKRIVQPTGKTTQEIASETAAAKRVFSDIEIPEEVTYNNVRTNIADKIKSSSLSQDEYLAKFPERFKPEQLGTYTKVGDETVVTNPVQDALDGLESAYKQSGEAVQATKIKQLREKLDSEGLNVSELNQLAKEYNIEFKNRAFDKMGNPKQGYNAENYENVRKGVKQTLRDRLPDETSKAIDAEISDLYETNRLIDRMAVQVEKAVAAAPKEGILKKAIGGAVGTADMLTGNIVSNIIRSIGSRAGIRQTKLSALDLQKELQKNLDEFQKLSTDPKKLSEKLNEYVTEDLSPGLGIRSTVPPPAKIAEDLTLGEYRTISEYLLNPADKTYFPKAQALMEKLGIENADDASQMKFLQEVKNEYDAVLNTKD